MVKKFISLLVVMGVIGGGAMLATAENSPVLDEGVVPHDGLDAIYRRFSEGYKKLDPAVVANLYSESAAYLAPGKEIEIGRTKVLATFTEFFDSVRQKNGRLEISFRIAQRQAEQNLAYDVGIYTLTSFSDKGESRTSKGKFMVVGKREKDGTWRFQVDGYNDMPKPPKPPGDEASNPKTQIPIAERQRRKMKRKNTDIRSSVSSHNGRP